MGCVLSARSIPAANGTETTTAAASVASTSRLIRPSSCSARMYSATTATGLGGTKPSGAISRARAPMFLASSGSAHIDAMSDDSCSWMPPTSANRVSRLSRTVPLPALSRKR